MSDDPPFQFEINCRSLAECFTCSLGCHGNQLALVKDAGPKVLPLKFHQLVSQLIDDRGDFYLLTHLLVPVSKFSGGFCGFPHPPVGGISGKKMFSSANIEAGTWVELFELFLDFFSTENDCQSGVFRRNPVNVLTVPLPGQ
jgi:hypothetical protein